MPTGQFRVLVPTQYASHTPCQHVNAQLGAAVLVYGWFLLLFGIRFECALCSLTAGTGSIVVAVFSVLECLAKGPVTVSRVFQEKVLVALFG